MPMYRKSEREAWLLPVRKIKDRQTSGASSLSTRKAEVQRFQGWRGIAWLLLRYGLVGVANTLMDLAILNMLLWCFPPQNVSFLVVYNAVAYTSGSVSSFLLNKYWTFGHKQRPTRREMGRFVISLALEIFWSSGLVWLAGVTLHPFIANVVLWSNASKLLAVAGSVAFSYVCMRFWTFAGP
jgi:putative flippase GtrA